jgi:hypothetical protein
LVRRSRKKVTTIEKVNNIGRESGMIRYTVKIKETRIVTLEVKAKDRYKDSEITAIVERDKDGLSLQESSARHSITDQPLRDNNGDIAGTYGEIREKARTREVLHDD